MAGSDTLSVILKIAPQAKLPLVSECAKWIDKYASAYDVTTEKRKAAFFARAAHETANFQTLREYADGSAYEGRKDLGNVLPGDGKKFRGRGIFQTTGRANYKRVSQVIFKDERLLTKPELLETPQYAVLSAYIFWKDHDLNKYADAGDMTKIVRIINGGVNGLKETLEDYATALALLLKKQVAKAVVYIKTPAATPEAENSKVMIIIAVVVGILFLIYGLTKKRV
jgi:putative chitinase